MDHFKTCWTLLHHIEGSEWSNDPADAGGSTRYGVTEALARRKGYTGPMEILPEAVAMTIAKEEFWDACSLDGVIAAVAKAGLAASQQAELAFEILECGYHAGPATPGRFLQRILNALNYNERYYPDVVVDGQIGAKTLESLRAFLAQRGAEGFEVMLRAMNQLQGAFLIGRAEDRALNEKFIYGWLLKRAATPNIP